ncbi:MarR family winged helix-turn-helix transcriptional regulator [Pelagibius sp. Alg239-R121]|uniref:MarR family winged helix-turn-helix transcriptional regulator n=1 Tax=Pelagibius sp. Alg239-R121 TaxID=2993448 RepID=UPI0024A75A1E|nr:winged helix DNA-binding protein [Pelagibius sp. Alg239-R121]
MDQKALSYKLRDGLGYRVSRLARVMERDFERRLAGLGITRLMWCVLPTVGLENIERPSDIAEHIGVDRTALSRVLREMEAKDLVRRARDDSDGRSTRVSLTRKGRRCLDGALPQSQGTTNHFGGKLNCREVEILHRLIDKLLSGEEGALPGI